MLILDAGNSRIKWGWWAQGRIVDQGVCDRAEALPGPRELRCEVGGTVRAAAVSVAASTVRERLAAVVLERWGVTLEFLVPSPRFGELVCAYEDPARLGVDRWAAIVAAATRYGLPAVVVDCGTAVTIDCICAEGRHRGGVILPGLATMRRSLHSGTANLPEVLGPAEGLLGTDTVAAIRNGTFYAVVGAVDRIVGALDDVTDERGTHYLVTGGDAALFRGHFAHRYQHDPTLVLTGAALLAAGP
ncbi:type III pantothenate kinase [Ectothiorhodospiraceae bacterium WFHF3C12]|nr:type III pantothenate kinase [Ectothiorhodospiraceae bacterium WFHF3C12]